MQNQGGITNIILQEMTWLIILMTVRGQLHSHVNERGLLISFFFFYRVVVQLQNRGRNSFILLFKNWAKGIIFCYTSLTSTYLYLICRI